MSQRLDKARYAVHGPWREQLMTEHDVLPDGVEYHVADLKEVWSGHVWHAGAHKVKLPKGAHGLRSTTFYGEWAWSDAARLIRDYDNWRRFHR